MTKFMYVTGDELSHEKITLCCISRKVMEMCLCAYSLSPYTHFQNFFEEKPENM